MQCLTVEPDGSDAVIVVVADQRVSSARNGGPPLGLRAGGGLEAAAKPLLYQRMELCAYVELCQCYDCSGCDTRRRGTFVLLYHHCEPCQRARLNYMLRTDAMAYGASL